MNNYLNTENNEFYQQVKKNLELKEKVDEIIKKKLEPIKNIGNYFNTIDIYKNGVVYRKERPIETVNTNFNKSILDNKHSINNKIISAIDNCLISGYQKTRACVDNYQDLIKEYSTTRNQNADMKKAIDCFGKFCDLFNYGYVTYFEQNYLDKDIQNDINDFETSFKHLNAKQQEITRKYISELLCFVLLFNALDRKSGNVLVDENGQINHIDFDDELMNKGLRNDKDYLEPCIGGTSGKKFNAEYVLKKADKVNDENNIKTTIMQPRKDKYVNYMDILKKCGIQIGKESLNVVDNMLKINNNVIRAMFYNIKSAVPDCTFDEAKKHIKNKLDALRKYRNGLISELTQKCNSNEGNIRNLCDKHNCIIPPSQVVNDSIIKLVKEKLTQSSAEISKCKIFVDEYTEKDYKKDVESAEKLYSIQKGKDINFSVESTLPNISKKTNLFK